MVLDGPQSAEAISAAAAIKLNLTGLGPAYLADC